MLRHAASLDSGPAPEYYAQSLKGGHMRGSRSSSLPRRGITVLSLALIIIAVVIAVILLVHYLGHRTA
jgi:hypothetical protein